jgi:hypothetical protein
MRPIRSFILAFLLLSWSSVAAAQQLYNTTAEVTPIASQIVLADGVISYPQGDRVAVVLENPDPKPVLGAVLQITSDAKWVTVQAGASFTDLQPLPEVEPTKWLLVGKAGKYLVLIVESSPDGPPALQFLSVDLGEPQPEPVPDPDPTPEQPGDFAALTKMVAGSVAAMNEPRVATALARVYERVAADPGLQKGDASRARQQALLDLRGVTKPWDQEFAKWDAEARRVGVESLEAYRAAVKAVAVGLVGAQGVTTSTVQYRQVCVDGKCYLVPIR